MDTTRVTSSLIAALGLAVGATALTSCENDPPESVTAKEIAEGTGVADPIAEHESPAEITRELLLTGDQEVFDYLDDDRNTFVSFEELDLGFDEVNVFGAFDVDEDRTITEDEFHRSMFGFWDDDNDGFVEPSEYLANAQRWFPEDTTELENFADVDVNDDGRLAVTEFVANMDDIALFDQWDLDDDADIAAAELVKVLRDVWDIDKDQQLSKKEWGGPRPSEAGGIVNVNVAIVRPVDFVGTTVTGEATVLERVGERGFWLKNGEHRAFAVIHTDLEPTDRVPMKVGQRVAFNGLMVSEGAIDDLPGDVDAETRKTLDKQDAFLTIFRHHVTPLIDSGG